MQKPTNYLLTISLNISKKKGKQKVESLHKQKGVFKLAEKAEGAVPFRPSSRLEDQRQQ